MAIPYFEKIIASSVTVTGDDPFNEILELVCRRATFTHQATVPGFSFELSGVYVDIDENHRYYYIISSSHPMVAVDFVNGEFYVFSVGGTPEERLVTNSIIYGVAKMLGYKVPMNRTIGCEPHTLKANADDDCLVRTTSHTVMHGLYYDGWRSLASNQPPRTVFTITNALPWFIKYCSSLGSHSSLTGVARNMVSYFNSVYGSPMNNEYVLEQHKPIVGTSYWHDIYERFV